MIGKTRLSLKRDGGFSLVEMLMAMMILLMASGILAGGVPAAAQVYWKIIDTANAQTLLSTTMICLRDELDSASHITLNGSDITYTNAEGNRLQITPNYTRDEEHPVPGLYREYLSELPGMNLPPPRLLVSNAAANQNLLVEYSTPAKTSKGVVIFPKLFVKKWDKTGLSPDELASVENYKIRILWPS